MSPPVRNMNDSICLINIKLSIVASIFTNVNRYFSLWLFRQKKSFLPCDLKGNHTKKKTIRIFRLSNAWVKKPITNYTIENIG